MKRRIAIISYHASPLTGSCESDDSAQHIYIARIAQNLALLGHEIDVFTRCDNPNQEEVYQWLDGVRVIYVPAGPSSLVRKEDLLKLMPQFTSYMIRFLKQNRYDLVHANCFLSGLVALNLKRTTETPFVVTFHELGRVCKNQKNVCELLSEQFDIEERTVREAAHIIAKSQSEKLSLMYSYDAMQERISVVPFADENSNWPEITQQVTEIYERIIKSIIRYGDTARLALSNLRNASHEESRKAKGIMASSLIDSGNGR